MQNCPIWCGDYDKKIYKELSYPTNMHSMTVAFNKLNIVHCKDIRNIIHQLYAFDQIYRRRSYPILLSYPK